MIAALEVEGVRFDFPTDEWSAAGIIAAALFGVPLLVAFALLVTGWMAAYRAARTQGGTRYGR